MGGEAPTCPQCPARARKLTSGRKDVLAKDRIANGARPVPGRSAFEGENWLKYCTLVLFRAAATGDRSRSRTWATRPQDTSPDPPSFSHSKIASRFESGILRRWLWTSFSDLALAFFWWRVHDVLRKK